MKKVLLDLGFSEKEADVYLALLEYGTQNAAFIAKKIGYPKSTVLFLFGELLKRGYIRKTNRGRTQYFHADPSDLSKAKQQELDKQSEVLQKTIPLLEEMKSPFSSVPKVTFYEGVEGCRKAYWELLESETTILEFGVHKDLVEKLGQKFMDRFISERIKRGLRLEAISNENQIDRELQKLDFVQCREQRFFPNSFGEMFSSIAIYEDKVLLLNLHRDPFGILIQNHEFSTTMKTIYTVLWSKI